MSQEEFNRLLIEALKEHAVREALCKSMNLGALFHAEARRMIEALHYEKFVDK